MPYDAAILAAEYAKALPLMVEARRQLQTKLERIIGQLEDKQLVRAELGVPRIKEPDSLMRKAIEKGWREADSIAAAGDLIGARVICANTNDVHRFAELLRDELRTIGEPPPEVEDYIANPQVSGYRAIHFNLRIDVGPILRGRRFGCEVQVRTIVQDAWSELTHQDIYKDSTGLPEDLRARASDLAKLLSTADDMAQSIRDRVSALRPAPAEKLNLDVVTADSVVLLYAQTFGRSPKEYTLREAIDRMNGLGIKSLREVAATLSDKALHEKVRRAYNELTSWHLQNDRLLVPSIIATVKGERAAIAHVRRAGRKELEEIATRARSETLSELPETVEELLRLIDDDELPLESIAVALGASSECFCGQTIIHPDALEEALAVHYQVDSLDGLIEDAVTQSGLETGGFDNSSVCAYHADLFGKDD